MTIPNIGSGAINLSTGAGVYGNVAIGNTNTSSITLSGLIYSVDGNITLTTAAGDATNHEINITGGTDGADPFIATDGGDISFVGGEVELANHSNLTINSNRKAATTSTASGNISIAKAIDGTSDEDLTITADHSTANKTDEKITIGAIGTGDEIGKVKLDGRDGITLKGDITLSNKAGSDLDINGAVTIDGSVTIDTDNASAERSGSTVHQDGDINFSSTIDGNGGTDNLTIKAGDTAAGTPTLTLSGAIGGGTALDALSINAVSYTHLTLPTKA